MELDKDQILYFEVRISQLRQGGCMSLGSSIKKWRQEDHHSRQAFETLGRQVVKRKIRVNWILSLLVITTYLFINSLNIIEFFF